MKQQLLNIIDQFTVTEFTLFERFGEPSQLVSVLDGLRNVSEEAESVFSQLSNLQVRIAKSQLVAATAMLELLTQLIERTQLKLPAWERSLEEIKADWNLP